MIRTATSGGKTAGIHGQLEAQQNESAKPAARQQQRKQSYRRSKKAKVCKEAQLELPQPCDENVPPADRQLPGMNPAPDLLHPSSSPAPGPGSRPLNGTDLGHNGPHEHRCWYQE